VSADLAARFFALLFTDYELVGIDGTTFAIPRDGSIPVFTGASLSEIALQIAVYRGTR
jgi:hypothetical protein